jgi:hypothetical protein
MKQDILKLIVCCGHVRFYCISIMYFGALPENSKLSCIYGFDC